MCVVQYGEFKAVFFSISIDQEKQRKPLDMSHADITDEYVEMSIIPPLMRDEYSHLRLSHNLIGDGGVEEIAGAIQDDKSGCLVIDLRANKITTVGAVTLGEALTSNVSVTELYLSQNDIGGPGAAALSRAFAPTTGGFSAVSVFDVRQCNIDDAGAEIMGGYMVGNTALKRLAFCGNFIGDDGATAIAKALQNERCKMRQVNLANNKINERGGKMLGYSLKCNRELKQLVMSGNKIGDVGVAAFAESLEGVEEMAEEESENPHAMMDMGSGKQRKKLAEANPDQAKQVEVTAKPLQCGLRLLGLAGCGITDNGIADLGGSLRTNKCLSTLDIRCNSLTDDGIVALARSLEENTELRELYCGDNLFGAAACVSLGSALARNVSLLTLDISGCDLSKTKAAESLAEGLAGNGSLHELNISRSKLTDEGMQVRSEASCPLDHKRAHTCVLSLELHRRCGNQRVPRAPHLPQQPA